MKNLISKIAHRISKKMRFFICLSYNGKNYNGWQIQENAPTVQQALNNALSVIFRQDIQTTGCGRTDTGVHATEFFAHFELPASDLLTTYDLRHTTMYRLNGILPPDIAVHNIMPVRDDAHARFSATSRTYKYIISQQKDPFNNDLSWFHYGKLNIDLMNNAAALLLETTDFTSFAKLHADTKTNNCKLTHAQWTEHDSSLLTPYSLLPTPKLAFTIIADRFLRNMVRAIVGTLIEVGKERITLNDFKNIIESKNRSDAGFSVPAHALFLTRIEYPKDIFI